MEPILLEPTRPFAKTALSQRGSNGDDADRVAGGLALAPRRELDTDIGRRLVRALDGGPDARGGVGRGGFARRIVEFRACAASTKRQRTDSCLHAVASDDYIMLYANSHNN